uniref:CARD domain-containing protein n=1 Tax=Plectus sambesii TaxID=2011161 RepID=A0A914XLY1_9BILA
METVVKTLERCYSDLSTRLQYLELVTRLQSAGTITFIERQIIEAETMDFKKNGKLVELLMRKNVAAFESFLSALSETGQDHIRTYLIETGQAIEAESLR